MAGRLAMIRPLPFTISGSFGATNTQNLLTPDPKEVATFVTGATRTVDIDLGAAVSVDSFYAGFVGGGATQLRMRGGLAAANEFLIVNAVVPQSSTRVVPDIHLPYVADAPVTARYLRFEITPGATDATVGVIAAGLSVQPTWGHEFGAGRPIEDTGTAERLFSGGFGIYEGVRVGGYQWSFGDLSDAEVQALYALANDRGMTRSVLVIEDPTQSAGLNERVHWSLFDRLEAYERQVPGASRYAFKVRDWA